MSNEYVNLGAGKSGKIIKVEGLPKRDVLTCLNVKQFEKLDSKKVQGTYFSPTGRSGERMI
jgi:hypothetical protein